MAIAIGEQGNDIVEGNLDAIGAGLEIMHDLLDGTFSDDTATRNDAKAKMFFVIDALKEKVRQTEGVFSSGGA